MRINKQFQKLYIFLLFGLAVSYTNYSYSQDFWQQLNTPEDAKIIDISVNDSGHIFLAVANEPWGIGGVYRSIDNASTWTIVGMANGNIYSLHIDQFGHIYAGGSGWITKSMNN